MKNWNAHLLLPILLILAGANTSKAANPYDYSDNWVWNYDTQCLELRRYFADTPGRYALMRVANCRQSPSGSGGFGGFGGGPGSGTDRGTVGDSDPGGAR
jgi:hypothetical protein